MSRKPVIPSDAAPLLDRRRDVAAKLGISKSQVQKLERQGLLTRVIIPGTRSVRYDPREVAALAERWIKESKS